MLFAVMFEDAPGHAETRKARMPAHLAFLDTHADRISAAGPLLDDAGAPDGGLWLVDAPDKASVEALVRADPFWPTGLRAGVRIAHWRQVFREGARL